MFMQKVGVLYRRIALSNMAASTRVAVIRALVADQALFEMQAKRIAAGDATADMDYQTRLRQHQAQLVELHNDLSTRKMDMSTMLTKASASDANSGDEAASAEKLARVALSYKVLNDKERIEDEDERAREFARIFSALQTGDFKSAVILTPAQRALYDRGRLLGMVDESQDRGTDAADSLLAEAKMLGFVSSSVENSGDDGSLGDDDSLPASDDVEETLVLPDSDPVKTDPERLKRRVAWRARREREQSPSSILRQVLRDSLRSRKMPRAEARTAGREQRKEYKQFRQRAWAAYSKKSSAVLPGLQMYHKAALQYDRMGWDLHDLPEYGLTYELDNGKAIRAAADELNLAEALGANELARSAATKFQAIVRSYLSREFTTSHHGGAIQLQRLWRGHLGRHYYSDEEVMQMAEVEGFTREDLITQYQRTLDRYGDLPLDPEAGGDINEYLTKLGSLVEKVDDIDDSPETNAAATAIQKIWRGLSTRVDFNQERYIRFMLDLAKYQDMKFLDESAADLKDIVDELAPLKDHPDQDPLRRKADLLNTAHGVAAAVYENELVARPSLNHGLRRVQILADRAEAMLSSELKLRLSDITKNHWRLLDYAKEMSECMGALADRELEDGVPADEKDHIRHQIQMAAIRLETAKLKYFRNVDNWRILHKLRPLSLYREPRDSHDTDLKTEALQRLEAWVRPFVKNERQAWELIVKMAALDDGPVKNALFVLLPRLKADYYTREPLDKIVTILTQLAKGKAGQAALDQFCRERYTSGNNAWTLADFFSRYFMPVTSPHIGQHRAAFKSLCFPDDDWKGQMELAGILLTFRSTVYSGNVATNKLFKDFLAAYKGEHKERLTRAFRRAKPGTVSRTQLEDVLSHLSEDEMDSDGAHSNDSVAGTALNAVKARRVLEDPLESKVTGSASAPIHVDWQRRYIRNPDLGALKASIAEQLKGALAARVREKISRYSSLKTAYDPTPKQGRKRKVAMMLLKQQAADILELKVSEYPQLLAFEAEHPPESMDEAELKLLAKNLDKLIENLQDRLDARALKPFKLRCRAYNEQRELYNRARRKLGLQVHFLSSLRSDLNKERKAAGKSQIPKGGLQSFLEKAPVEELPDELLIDGLARLSSEKAARWNRYMDTLMRRMQEAILPEHVKRYNLLMGRYETLLAAGEPLGSPGVAMQVASLGEVQQGATVDGLPDRLALGALSPSRYEECGKIITDMTLSVRSASIVLRMQMFNGRMAAYSGKSKAGFAEDEILVQKIAALVTSVGGRKSKFPECESSTLKQEGDAAISRMEAACVTVELALNKLEAALDEYKRSKLPPAVRKKAGAKKKSPKQKSTAKLPGLDTSRR